MVLATAIDGGETEPTQFAIPVTDILMAIHFLFAGFVFANLVYYGSIIVSYRRLANG